VRCVRFGLLRYGGFAHKKYLAFSWDG
jgi:hypothetical protein